jgi:DNA-binding winged helix-turn-helix (wHTH) protein
MSRQDGGAARSSVSAAVPADEEQPPPTGTVFGPYTLWATLRRLERNGLPVHVGDRAFDILCVLAERPGKVVTNRELMARVWGTVVVGAGSLRFHINALRKVLAQDGRRAEYIRNVTRRGYTLIAPVHSSQSHFITLAMAQGVQEQLAIRGESVTLLAIVLGKFAVK